jgi:hypothetical protein
MAQRDGLKQIIQDTLKLTGGNVTASYERLSGLGVSQEYVRQVAQEMATEEKTWPVPGTGPQGEAVFPPEDDDSPRPQPESITIIPEDDEEPEPTDLQSLDELSAIHENPAKAFLNAIIPQNKLGLMRLRDTAIGNLQQRLDRDGVSNGHLLSLLRLTLEHEAALRALARPAAALIVQDQRTQHMDINFLVDKLGDLDGDALQVLAKHQPRVLRSVAPTTIDASDYEPKIG